MWQQAIGKITNSNDKSLLYNAKRISPEYIMYIDYKIIINRYHPTSFKILVVLKRFYLYIKTMYTKFDLGKIIWCLCRV